MLTDLEDLVGVVDRVFVVGDGGEQGIGDRDRLAAAVDVCQRQPVAAVGLDGGEIVGERDALDSDTVLVGAAPDSQLKVFGSLVILTLAEIERAQVGVEGRVGWGIAQGCGAVLDALFPLAQHAVDPGDEEVGGGVGGVERVGFGELEDSLVELIGVDLVAPQGGVDPGDVGVEPDCDLELIDRFFIVAGDLEHVAARPMRFQQVRLEGDGGARLFDGFVHRVELVHAGFDAQREDVGVGGVRQTGVHVELDRLFGVHLASKVFLLEALDPAKQGVGIGVGGVQQDRVLGVDLRLFELVGEDLETGDLEVVLDVLRVGVDGALVGFHRLQVLTFGRERVSLLDVGERVARRCGGGDKGRVHDRHHHQVEIK